MVFDVIAQLKSAKRLGESVIIGSQAQAISTRPFSRTGRVWKGSAFGGPGRSELTATSSAT